MTVRDPGLLDCEAAQGLALPQGVSPHARACPRRVSMTVPTELEASDSGIALVPGTSASVWADHPTDSVVLTIVDETRGVFTIAIPSQAASDLAVALVNAANRE